MSQEVFIVNLVMHTGTDFAQTYVLEDTASNSEKELNGFSACAQMRRYETSSVAAVFSLNFKKGGRIEMSMDRTVTSTLKPGKYFYDLVLKDSSGVKTRVVEGTIHVKKSITR